MIQGILKSDESRVRINMEQVPNVSHNIDGVY